MNKFKRGYVWKAVGLLLLLGALAAALFIGPALRGEPELGPPVRLPAMTNIPPAGSLRIEAPAEVPAPGAGVAPPAAAGPAEAP